MRYIQTAVFSLIMLVVALSSVQMVRAQSNKGALLRGYRTGYSDGYLTGYRDSVERAKRDHARHQDYIKANRVYRAEYGSLDDYRDGYQQGFEAGYVTGYDRREFDSSLPADLNRRGTRNSLPPGAARDEKPQNDEPPVLREPAGGYPAGETAAPAYNSNASGPQPTIIIPTSTEIIVEMLADINTDDSREGDSFLARVVAPGEIAGAIIEGRVAKIKRPGRIKGNAELQLSFSRIVLNERRWANFNATVIESLPMKGNNIKAIDEEGTVRGKGSLKTDTIKVGAASATGATIGAIAGGPVGFAVGAAIGGAVGVGGVLIERGKNINLVQGQQLRVRTNFESQIR